ncbi:fibronectin-III type domain-containing protein windei isoform X2 [Lycorma delicatula]|uniref:fibronectin-III type domain-containing protein windei isoform X2 n=1 Tax=Lycorma delicatula TaxID=130591 RepID=UPI003F519C79
MKLITNTVEEAKENIDLSVKENFEPETIFESNMKDIERNDVTNGIVNGSVDPAFTNNVKSINRTNVSSTNGFKNSDDENGVNSRAKYYDDVSDNELLFSLSDDEDLHQNESENIISKNTLSDKIFQNEDTEHLDLHSDVVLNGTSDSGHKNEKAVAAESVKLASEENCTLLVNNEDEVNVSSCSKENDKLGSVVEISENVKETIEICTTNHETNEAGCKQNRLLSPEHKNCSLENDEGSDVENDIEAEKKVLTLLQETPPELVIMPEDNNESEKDIESYIDEEKKLLSLLEDSQSDSSLNLLGEETVSSSLNEFDNDKKSQEAYKKCNDKNITFKEGTSVKEENKPKSLNVEKHAADSSYLLQKEEGRLSEGKQDLLLSSDLVKKDNFVDKPGKDIVGSVCRNLEKKGSAEEKCIVSEQVSTLCINGSTDDKKDNISNILEEEKVCSEEDKGALSDFAELDDVEKHVGQKRNRVKDIPRNGKKLKRSTSCDENTESKLRKRTHSLDGIDVEISGVKRLRQDLEKDTSYDPLASLKKTKRQKEELNGEKDEDVEYSDSKNSDNDSKLEESVEKLSEITDSGNDENDAIDKSEVGDSTKEKVNEKNSSVENSKNEKSDENSDDHKEKEGVTNNVGGSDEDTDEIRNVPSEDVSCVDLDLSIESDAQDTMKYITKNLPLMKTFHKEKFKSLSKSDLEELIVQKICESIADRSVIGELRLRVRSLEQSIDHWRKKSQIIEKSNRELRTVLARYLKEVDDNIAGKEKPLIPIRITRSVGLQVTPPPGYEKVKGVNRSQQQKQPDNIRILRPALSPNNNSSSISNSNTINRKVQSTNHVVESPASSATGTVVAGNKRVLPASPVVSTTLVPGNSSSDLEVIDLTEKEERNKNVARGVMTPNGIRLVPRQLTTSSSGNAIGTTAVGQRMTYLVPTSAMQAVQGNQRQQLILTATTPNGTAQIRPVSSAAVVASRSNPSNQAQTLAIPGTAVIMKNGAVMPITSPSTTNVVVRSSNTFVPGRNVQQLRLTTPNVTQSQPLMHPAPLPPCPTPLAQPGWLLAPPRPILKVSKTTNGIMLSWSMQLNKNNEEIASYQLYAYQESNSVTPNSSLWKKVGDVKALPLPMACTLTQFVEGHKYHFAVRAVDVHSRVGQFSTPSTILLK